MAKIGRLAQFWLERLLDMQEATRSSRVPPILNINSKFQIPNPKQISIIEIINPGYKFKKLEFCNFNIVWNLVLGFWNFNRVSVRLS